MASDSRTERLAANIRAEMARSKTTQSMLAAHLGKNQQFIQRRLAGQVPFTVDELLAVAEALNVSLEELLSEQKAAS